MSPRPESVPPSFGPTLARRRLFMALANGAVLLVIVLATARIAAAGGWTPVDIGLLVCALAITPWHALGFLNALTGLWLLHGHHNGVVQAAPFLKMPGVLPPRGRVALLMTLRNEDPARAVARLRAMKADLDATSFGASFDYHLLSDTSLEEVAAAEEDLVARWRAEEGAAQVFYRRRASNTGFKAGNIRDFCLNAGATSELMLPLDADSLMGGETILKMVGIMQAHPEIGILQSLVVGLPARSAFARLFQFGMRHGMRCYTLGATWWAGDGGPYWGHNALIRIVPFRDACDLPLLPGAPPLGGPILSHDQVEAALMRRAGYEVRVLPLELESYEENPPTVTDFITRDLRWCLGNMQYLRLLDFPGLHPMSRFQLVWAIAMFVTVPALPLLLVLLPFAAVEARGVADYPTGLALALYGGLVLMSQTPKLAGLTDVALTRGGVARYGGAGRFAASAAIEIAFSFLLGAVTSMAVTVFLVRLALGRARVRWSAQAREGHRISWRAAAGHFWGPTVFGLAVSGAVLAVAPALFVWLVPLLAGYVLAIPFAVVTADPRFGALLARHRLCATPEEIDPPPVVRALGREAAPRLERVA